MSQTTISPSAILQQLFPPRLAGWVSAPATRDSPEKYLPAVWRRAFLALVISRLLALSPHPDPASLLLALHVCGASFDELARIAGLKPAQLATLLLDARARLADQWVPPCSEGAELVARWREFERDRDARVRLALHAQHCTTCRAALAASQQADLRLLSSPSAGRPLSSSHRARIGCLGRVTVLLLTLTLVLVLWQVTLSRPEVVPATDLPAVRSGPFLWLGSAGPYSVLFDSAARTWLPSGTRLPADAGAFRLLSPNGQLIAAWTPDPPREPRWLDILQLNGARLARWRWDGPTTRRFLAWLDAETILVRETPTRLAFEREAEYFERLERDSRLLTIDVSSGKETTLFQGLVIDAVPAPDGGGLALIRASTPFGPGATSQTIDLALVGAGRTVTVVVQVDGYIGGQGDRPLWLPDSSAVVLARRPPGELARLPTATELIMVHLDGRTTVLVPSQAGIALRPLAIAPDASRLLYLAAASGQHEQGTVWELVLATGERRMLLHLNRLSGSMAALWLGDDPVLVVVRTLGSPHTASPEIEFTEIYQLGKRSNEPLASLPGRWGFDAAGRPLLSLLTRAPDTNREQLRPPRGQLAEGQLELAPGGYWLLAPTELGKLALWDTSSGIRLTEPWPLSDAAWHPAGTAFFAIGSDQQLRVVARSLDGLWQPESFVLRGLLPQHVLWVTIAPNGRLAGLSEGSNGELILWAAFPPEATILRSWRREEVAGPPCAAWRTADTLVLVTPLASGHVSLELLRIDNGGSLETTLLTRLRPFLGQGSKGCTLALNSIGQNLAIRIQRGDTDAVLLLHLNRPDKALLLASGPASAGLVWSPDGTVLAYGLGSTLTAVDGRGHELLRVPVGRLADLAWLGERTLWVLQAKSNTWNVVEVPVTPPE